jgi:hypothetical protein
MLHPVGAQQLHGVGAGRRRWRRSLRQGPGVPGHIGQALQHHPVGRTPVKGMGIIPPFREQLQHICHNRATKFEGGVVPRRLVPVPGIHVYRLRISRVIGVVPTAVGKVDSADERDVP